MSKEILLKKSNAVIKDSIEASEDYSLTLSDYMRKPKKVGIRILDKSDKDQTEVQVVAECTKYLRGLRWVVKLLYTGGIPLAGGKRAPNPAKGIPDCVAFHPESGKMIWIEYKRSHGGLISEDQKIWHDLLRICGQKIYVINSLKSLKTIID